MDPCGEYPCLFGSCLIDSIGKPVCACTAGFRGTSCDIDVDECKAMPCKNGGSCINFPGTYVCACQDQYTGRNCELNMNHSGNLLTVLTLLSVIIFGSCSVGLWFLFMNKKTKCETQYEDETEILSQHDIDSQLPASKMGTKQLSESMIENVPKIKETTTAQTAQSYEDGRNVETVADDFDLRKSIRGIKFGKNSNTAWNKRSFSRGVPFDEDDYVHIPEEPPPKKVSSMFHRWKKEFKMKTRPKTDSSLDIEKISSNKAVVKLAQEKELTAQMKRTQKIPSVRLGDAYEVIPKGKSSGRKKTHTTRI